MRDEIIRQEEQLREVKKNNTNLERKMEYERQVECERMIYDGFFVVFFNEFSHTHTQTHTFTIQKMSFPTENETLKTLYR